MLNSKAELAAIVADTSIAEGLPPEFIMAIVDTLSEWHPERVEQSPDPMAFNPTIQRLAVPNSRLGLLQINPEAAKELGFKQSQAELLEPALNVSVGCKLLKKSLEQCGNNADRALLVTYGYSVASLIPQIQSKVGPYKQFLALRPADHATCSMK
jgi:hypothetical protein